MSPKKKKTAQKEDLKHVPRAPFDASCHDTLQSEMKISVSNIKIPNIKIPPISIKCNMCLNL